MINKILFSIVAVLAMPCIAISLRTAAAAPPSKTDISGVTVTAYKGDKTIVSMSGPDCVALFYVLPLDVKTRIANAWDMFAKTAGPEGTCSGVKYSFNRDMTFEYSGLKIVATNLTPEMLSRIVDNIE